MLLSLHGAAVVTCMGTVTISPPCAEALAFSCFTELMKRMNQNFPHGGAMDTHFANMRSLIQVGWPWLGFDSLFCSWDGD